MDPRPRLIPSISNRFNLIRASQPIRTTFTGQCFASGSLQTPSRNDALAFGFILPTARRIRDFHPLERATAGCTKKIPSAAENDGATEGICVICYFGITGLLSSHWRTVSIVVLTACEILSSGIPISKSAYTVSLFSSIFPSSRLSSSKSHKTV